MDLEEKIAENVTLSEKAVLFILLTLILGILYFERETYNLRGLVKVKERQITNSYQIVFPEQNIHLERISWKISRGKSQFAGFLKIKGSLELRERKLYFLPADILQVGKMFLEQKYFCKSSCRQGIFKF